MLYFTLRYAKENSKWQHDYNRASYRITCLTWFLYSFTFCIKISIIFGSKYNIINRHYDEIDAQGCKFIIGLCSVVFLLLVLVHQDKSSTSIHHIETYSKTVSIDLLDIVQFLDLLIINETGVMMTFELHNTILNVACLNVILPLVILMSFSKTQFGKLSFSVGLEVIHFLYQLCLNVPMAILRSFVYSTLDILSSTFLLKNLLSMLLAGKNFFAHVLDSYDATLSEPGNNVEIETSES